MLLDLPAELLAELLAETLATLKNLVNSRKALGRLKNIGWMASKWNSGRTDVVCEESIVVCKFIDDLSTTLFIFRCQTNPQGLSPIAVQPTRLPSNSRLEYTLEGSLSLYQPCIPFQSSFLGRKAAMRDKLPSNVKI
jgi:hypothetical protein